MLKIGYPHSMNIRRQLCQGVMFTLAFILRKYDVAHPSIPPIFL